MAAVLSGASAAIGHRLLVAVTAAACAAGCSRPPPGSVFPTAADAIGRMRSTYECSRGVAGESKVDYFGERGRVRGSALFATSRPERLRFDVVSPFGVTLSTLTSDGRDFALLDVGAKTFWVGPATECNVERFLHVPVPPHALVALLSGEAPVLVHAPEAARISWSSGSYLVTVPSTRGAFEEIRLAPTPADWDRPWSEQRLRVVDVRVEQQGIELYHAELSDFAAAAMSKPRVDPDGIDPEIPPSGPPCRAEIPHRVRITSEASGDDVLLVHREIAHNPPVEPSTFRQSPPGGVRLRTSVCGVR